MISENNSKFQHQSKDRFLSTLSVIDGLVGKFVQNYPGTGDQTTQGWLDNWFDERTKYYFKHTSRNVSDEIQVDDSLDALPVSSDTIVMKPVRLVSIQPYYFRGFRNLSAPVILTGNLIVIDGRNSSGKTSITEAIEWLLTGELLRRKLQEQGSPRELENCISNQLKPEDEETWVEAEFVSDSNEHLRLRRVLIRDYGDTSTSKPETALFLNGNELTKDQGIDLLDEFFAGVPPLLMQHSLRLFVQSTPQGRRDYFERLLQLDELTDLIGKAVVGNSRLSDFSSPAGSIAWTKWERIKSLCEENTSKTILRRTERDQSDDLQSEITNALTLVAHTEFSDLISPEAEFNQIKTMISAKQQTERQRTLPILRKIRPKQILDDKLRGLFSDKIILDDLKQLQLAYNALKSAKEATKSVGDAQIAIARAFEDLSQAGLIIDSSQPQTCSLCNYQDVPTLSVKRIQEIRLWQPIYKAVAEAKKELGSQVRKLLASINELYNARNNLIPSKISDEEWAIALEGVSDTVKDTAGRLRQIVAEAVPALDPFDKNIDSLRKILGSSKLADQEIEQAKNMIDELPSKLASVVEISEKYANGFKALESAVGSLTREDPTYTFREIWLSLADDLEAISTDIKWEQAKKKAQNELQTIRDFLISARQRFLDSRRVEFSEGMTEVWGKLRADRYSTFNTLFIPEPRGRGFPVEIEVKAVLDDGNQQHEVDALRVFSESQVNVLGLAAFATRAKLLGHRAIIFDDPVQSMDEEHFKTFASELIPHLLNLDFQVILLTHNETFAREVSYSCLDVDNYVTMSIRHSRRSGCQVDEGNRRVAERLKKAEKKGDDGKLDEAWLLIRLALERLYTVTYTKYGPDNFNPLSWIDQTVEYMWGNVGSIIEEKAPGMGLRLKEILDMTVAGAHDKSSHGTTDLTLAIKDLRSLLGKLRVGSG